MPITDPNEVTAYLRACQDPEKLRALQKAIGQRIQGVQQSFAANPQGRPYVQELVHTGGLHQMPMTGPGPAPVMGTSTAEQALINQATFQQRAQQGRLPEQQSPARRNPIVTEGQGPTHLAQEAARRDQVLADVREGELPLEAEALAREDVMGSQGVLEASQMGGDETTRTKALDESSKEEGKKLREGSQKAFDEQHRQLREQLQQQASHTKSPDSKGPPPEGEKQAKAPPSEAPHAPSGTSPETPPSGGPQPSPPPSGGRGGQGGPGPATAKPPETGPAKEEAKPGDPHPSEAIRVGVGPPKPPKP